MALALYAPFVAAQQPEKIRFSNWEFDKPGMMNKSEQTGDKFVLKLDPSIPGAGGTITLQAGRPLKGALSAQLDSEWKRLSKGHKLLKPEPDQKNQLLDGTEGLMRGAPTANGGYFSVSVYQAPGGFNSIIFDAGDEMANQILGGATFGFFMSLKLRPTGSSTSLAQAGTNKEAPLAEEETPLEELSRLQQEMINMPMPDMDFSSTPAERIKPEDLNVEPIPIPKLDKTRIASIPARVLNDQEIQKYVRETVPLVKAKLSPEIRALGDKILHGLNAKHSDYIAIENTAIGVYALGNIDLALYLMGTAAKSNQADSNTLNNYAALLSMEGAEQRAIVILQNLEKKYPDNSTVLNNLAQAWFGLGDIAKADEYLDRTLRRFPGHSQANVTRSAIQESKGNKQAAVKSMKKSMQQGFSEEKLAQLERLGYDLTGKDIPWDEPFKEDPLKLHKVLALVPPYYFKAKDSPVAKARWDAYYRAINNMKEQEQELRPGLKLADAEAVLKFMSDLVAGRKRFSPLAIKFTRKYITYGKRHEELMDQLQRWNREANVVHDEIGVLNLKMSQQLKANRGAPCGTEEAIVTEFMSQANGLLSNLQSEARIKDMIRWSNEWAQIYRYYNSPTKQTYALYLNGVKSTFLSYMSGLKHYHFDGYPCSSNKASSPRSLKLVHFEDIHCDKHYSFTVPMIGTIRGNCHYLTTEFDVLGIVKGTTKDDLLTGEFVNGTLEIGVSKGVGSDEGPVQVEVHGGGFIEVGKDGITDIGVTGGVEVRAGTDVFEAVEIDSTIGRVATDLTGQEMPEGNQTEVSVGVSTRIGVNSGAAVSGTGLAKGFI